MINKVAATSAFTSKVLVAGYGTFSDRQKEMVRSREFLDAFKELSENGDDNTVFITASTDSNRDLTMSISGKTGDNEATTTWDWLYADDKASDIVDKYNDFARDDVIWRRCHWSSQGHFIRVSGELADYTV